MGRIGRPKIAKGPLKIARQQDAIAKNLMLSSPETDY
jgi:hypothetical protein